jgi:hypothetical protein
MFRRIDHCTQCGKKEVRSDSDEMDSIESECICEDQRVKCDGCAHHFLQKDMDMNNMFLALCKICNQREPHIMDNVAVARFRATEHPASMLCVQLFGDKLQLTMRVYHLGLSMIFPAMTKQELMTRWFLEHPGFNEMIEADYLFNAAILRLKDKYITHEELISFRRQMFTEVKSNEEVTPVVVGV